MGDSSVPTPKRSGVGAWKQPFLEALADTGAVTLAAEAVGINRVTVYEQRDRDEDFRAAMVDVQERCIEEVEKTAYQRARDGISDTAVIFWLKSRRPHIYGDRLRHEEREQIRAEARAEAIEEMKREIDALTPAARKVLQRAIPQS